MFSDDLDPVMEGKVEEINQFVMKGVTATLLDHAKADGKIYSFNRFEIYQVYLDIAKNLKDQACEFLGKIEAKKINKKNYMLVSKDSEKDFVWQFFMSLIGSIIFSYTAIEAYVNKRILEGYTNEALFEKGKNTELYFPHQDIHKTFPLKRKLKEVLPLIYPNKRTLISKFLEGGIFSNLETLRHALIHLKESEIRTGANRDSKIWNKLMPRMHEKKLRFDPYNLVKKFINDFQKSDN